MRTLTNAADSSLSFGGSRTTRFLGWASNKVPGTVRLLWRPLGVFLLSRLVVFAAIMIAGIVDQRDGLMASLGLWDGNWYLSIARGGYELPTAPPWRSNVAFFPLLPLSIRGASTLSGAPALWAAVVVVHLYGAALTVVLWLLVRRLTDRDVADRTTWLFWFFPGAAVFSMVYAEPVMVTFAAACLLALLTRRWLIAGGAAALAGAARPTGIALAACCLWESVRAVRRDGEWRSLVAPALAPLGLLGFFGYLWTLSGRPDTWFAAQRAGWGAGIDFGASIVGRVVGVVQHPLDINAERVLELFGLGLVAIGVFLLWRWRPPGVIWVYTIGVLAFGLLSETATAAGTRPRLVLAAFPLIVAVARFLRGKAFLAAIMVSGALMAASAVIYTTRWWVIP
jgi:hypothetical protein